MLEYSIQINNGVEAFGTTGKTITVNEAPKVLSQDFLAEEIHHANELIPKKVVEEVLSNFGKTAARLMAEGIAIQFLDGKDVLMRLYADVKVKGGNINLARARELDPTVTDITPENASSLVQKAGLQVRAYAEVEQKFTELLRDFKPSLQLKDVTERAYVAKKDSSDDGGGGQQQGGSQDDDPNSMEP